MRIFSLLFFILFSLTGNSYALDTSKIVLNDLNGNKIPFQSLKGKWIFINYWASWCQPCLDEIDELNQFYQAKKEKIALFAVNFDMLALSNQRAMAQKYHLSYPSLRDDPAAALDLGDIRGVPATFVFNPEGKLVNVLYGSQTLASLNKALKISG